MSQEQVILLHGLGRGRGSMYKIAASLINNGYRIFNPGYNGLLDNYREILTSLDKKINDWLEPGQKVHFVGHSFGGILIRGLIAQNPQWDKGRCVMLGTPNQGTGTASFMLSHWWFKYFVPRVTKDLIPDSQLLKSLPEPEIETGVIAGNIDHSMIIPVSWYYKKATDSAPGDGVVELANTHCDGMTDFIVMPLHHSFMTSNKWLVAEVVNFIQKGYFSEKYRKVADQPLKATQK